MAKKKTLILMLLVTVWMSASNLFAQADTTNSKWQLSGSAEAYYQYNFNETGSLTSFTTEHNSFVANMISLKASKQMGKVGVVGDIGFGQRVDDFNYNYSGITSVAIKQLYLTYALSDKLTATAGNFYTHVGYELTDAKDNKNYSMSYMFSYGPFFHTGIKLNAALTPNVGAMLGIFNDTDTKFDVTKGKHIGAQVSATAGGLSVYANYLGGNFFNEDVIAAHQLDLTASYTLSDALGLGLNATIRNAEILEGAEDDSWSGLALYANYAVSDAFRLAFRGEYLNDADGVLFSTPDLNITALTLSANLTKDNLTLLPEFRYEMASEEFFTKDGSAVKTMPSVLCALIYSF